MNDTVEPRIVKPGFHRQVYDVVRQIPVGSVATYGDIATYLGSPRVARHVGWALAGLASSDPEEVPWHRVINAQGRISHRGDIHRAELQQALLCSEGIEFRSNGTIDILRWRWRPALHQRTD